jgi:hypothetical protein
VALFLFPLGVFLSVPLDIASQVLRGLVLSLTGKDAESVDLFSKVIGGSSLASLLLFATWLYINTRNRLGLSRLSLSRLIASLTGRPSTMDLTSDVGFRHRFAAEFKDVADALKPITMLVVIDDLDRCLPENVLAVLETVNFLVSSGDCYLILGLDLAWVEQCVGEAYRHIVNRPLEETGRTERTRESRTAHSEAIPFAGRYLQKLINIEVPVPRPTDEDASRLTTPARDLKRTSQEKTVADKARRIKVAHVAIISLFWIGFCISLVLVGNWVGTQLTQMVMTKDQSTQSGIVDADEHVPPSVELQSAIPADLPSRSDAPSEPGRFKAPDEARISWWWIGSPLLLIGSIVLLIGREQWRRRASAVTRDSPNFEVALQTWAPVVLAKQWTPRSVKRYVNRVRYFAMRQKASSEPLHIPESAIVGLAALHHWGVVQVQDPGFLAKLTKSAQERDEESFIASNADEIPEGLASPLYRALRECTHHIGWPPAEEEIMTFGNWSTGIKVA